MITMAINFGTGYRNVNPYRTADRNLIDAATQVTVTIYGADKAPILREAADKLAHFAPHFTGITVTTSEVTDGEEFSVTVSGLIPGAAFYIGIILTRMAGRQQGVKDAACLTFYPQRSKARKQFIKQFCPSVCSNGSDLRDGTDAVIFGNPGYVRYIDPLFTIYGMYGHGSI